MQLLFLFRVLLVRYASVACCIISLPPVCGSQCDFSGTAAVWQFIFCSIFRWSGTLSQLMAMLLKLPMPAAKEEDQEDSDDSELYESFAPCVFCINCMAVVHCLIPLPLFLLLNSFDLTLD